MSEHGGIGNDAGSVAGMKAGDDDGLLNRLEVIETQPLGLRAAGFDQLAEELLSELQSSDRETH